MTRSSANLIEHRHGETIAYNVAIQRLGQHVRVSDAVISSLLPRGGIQVVQPRQTDVGRMRIYCRYGHALDPVAWGAIAHRTGVRLSDVAGEQQLAASDANAARSLVGGRKLAAVAARFRDLFLRPFGLEHYVAIPLESPVLDGYPGVLHAYRTSEVGDFSDADVRKLMRLAGEFDAAHERRRDDVRFKRDIHPLAHHLRHRPFVAPMARKIAVPVADDDELDDVLRHNLLDHVEGRLKLLEEADAAQDAPTEGGAGENGFDERLRPIGVGSNADRLLVPDRLGDCWAFRLALFPRYPALTGVLDRDEPVAIVSHQPDCEAWSSLRPSDFAADDEIARLIPALQYMQENFAGEASLQRIARVVHLSPFHFHRRFTDLLGITPKHYLFDCQVAEAKRQLAAGEMDLKEIAAHCGFAHQSHFTSRFKQATGLTPTQWRRLASEAAAD